LNFRITEHFVTQKEGEKGEDWKREREERGRGRKKEKEVGRGKERKWEVERGSYFGRHIKTVRKSLPTKKHNKALNVSRPLLFIYIYSV
jgi:hypothetical protein